MDVLTTPPLPLAELGGRTPLDLVAGAVHKDNADVERAQDREIEQEIREVFRLDNLAI